MKDHIQEEVLKAIRGGKLTRAELLEMIENADVTVDDEQQWRVSEHVPVTPPRPPTPEEIVAQRLKMINDSIDALRVYADPDLSEIKALLKEVAEAGKLGPTDGWIQALEIHHNDMLFVEIAWSCRGYTNSILHYIPMSIFRSVDHVRAAKVYSACQRRDGYEAELKIAKSNVERYTRLIAEETKLLDELGEQ